MSEPKHPLKPNQLGALYPQAKTYDELQVDQAATRKLRESWQPKHPRLLIAAIILMLGMSFWLIVTIFAPLAANMPMLGVPAGLLAGIFWVFGLVGSINKIRNLFNQVALSYDDQSHAGASHDQQ